MFNMDGTDTIYTIHFARYGLDVYWKSRSTNYATKVEELINKLISVALYKKSCFDVSRLDVNAAA